MAFFVLLLLFVPIANSIETQIYVTSGASGNLSSIISKFILGTSAMQRMTRPFLVTTNRRLTDDKKDEGSLTRETRAGHGWEDLELVL